MAYKYGAFDSQLSTHPLIYVCQQQHNKQKKESGRKKYHEHEQQKQQQHNRLEDASHKEEGIKNKEDEQTLATLLPSRWPRMAKRILLFNCSGLRYANGINFLWLFYSDRYVCATVEAYGRCQSDYWANRLAKISYQVAFN